MNHKALAIVPIVAFIAVNLLLLTPMLADGKIGTSKDIRLDAIGQGLPGPVGLPAAEAPPGPPDTPGRGPPSAGHVTFYTIPYGHDGWVLSNFNGQTAYVGPVSGSVFATAIAPPINGTDLTAITSNSVVIAQVHNSNELYSIRSQSVSDYAMCNVWDVFTHGFHLACNFENIQPVNPPFQPELRVAVINP